MEPGDKVTIVGTVVSVREDNLVVVEVVEGPGTNRHIAVHPSAAQPYTDESPKKGKK